MRHIGVDGCKAGWLAVTRNGVRLEYHLVSKVDDLVYQFPEAERILIDIPIGLPWIDAPIRPCDRIARELLGRRRKSSVFAVPCREALAVDGLEAARRINQACIGRSIGAQTSGISPKIAEVDRLLRTHGAPRRSIREIHPEVCFWALAGRNPMTHSKTTLEGREERLRILRRYEPRISLLLSDALSKTLRKDVQADDVLDAAVAFVTAEATAGELRSLVGVPSHDPAGLPMEMLYLKTWDAVAIHQMRREDHRSQSVAPR
jgi:predicted RNase H-like nuclease